MTSLTVIRCKIEHHCRSPYEMLDAVIKDNDHNVKYRVREWINPIDHHCNREDSNIVHNYKSEYNQVAINELFDVLDKRLDEIWTKEHANEEPKAQTNLFTKLASIFGLGEPGNA